MITSKMATAFHDVWTKAKAGDRIYVNEDGSVTNGKHPFLLAWMDVEKPVDSALKTVGHAESFLCSQWSMAIKRLNTTKETSP